MNILKIMNGNISSKEKDLELSYFVYHYPIQDVLAANLSQIKCYMVEGHSKNTSLRTAQILQILVCIIGILALAYKLHKYKNKLNFLDFNFKIFVWILCAFAILHNIFTIFIHCWHQYSYIFFEDCHRLIVAWHCVTLRGPQQLGIVGINVAEVIILVDRIWASFRPQIYAKEQSKATAIFAIFALIIPISTVIYIFGQDADLTLRSYCALTTTQTRDQVRNVYMFLLCVNILSCLGFVGLLLKNKKMLKTKAHKFDVNGHFQMISNIRSLNFSIRLMLSSFVINLLSFTINSYFRIELLTRTYYVSSFALEASYLFHFHALGIALVMFIDHHSNLSKVEPMFVSAIAETSIHFESIHKAWN